MGTVSRKRQRNLLGSNEWEEGGIKNAILPDGLVLC